MGTNTQSNDQVWGTSMTRGYNVLGEWGSGYEGGRGGH